MKVNRIEIKEMMDRKERMDMVKKISAIRYGIAMTQNTEDRKRIDDNDKYVKSVVISKAIKNYCRESWLYRALEFIGLR
jgi:hypothetical protein